MKAELETKSRNPLIIGSVALLLVVVGIGWALSGGTEDEPKSTLPEEWSVESLKAKVEEDPGKLREVFEQRGSEDLTEEQRRELRQNLREVHRSTMDTRVDEYFAAAEEDRQATLDRHIDEFQERMKEWEQRRRERQERREQDGERRGPPDWASSQTREERKTESESRDPDDMARRMAYFSAVQERMTERGIETPWGRGGRGPGRGPGGPGRGGPGRGGPGRGGGR
jgi:uncharacterized membrane protein